MPILSRGEMIVDYLSDGVGPAVVLVHSSVSGNRQWKHLTEALRSKYQCLAPNLLGYGQTPAWPGERAQTLEDAAQVALALCQTVVGPIRLVGHSWGAAVALAIANTLGERVSHLTLYEPMLVGLLRGHGRTEAWSEAQGIYASVRKLGDAENWDALAEVFTDYFNGDGAWAATPPDRRRIIAMQLPPNRHEWDASVSPMNAQSFSGIRAKTLILRGSQTRLVTKETADVLRESFPQWQLQEIHGAGHMGPLTHGALVNAKIEAFLAT